MTRNDYLNYPVTLKMVDEYILTKDINAIIIKPLTLFKQSIDLEDTRKGILNFIPPQMYFVLDNHPKLKYIKKTVNR